MPNISGSNLFAAVSGNLDTLVAAFNQVFAVSGRAFGAAGRRRQGVSDDAKGVQWNAGVDSHEGYAWLGVNLEGMAYGNWPIARFIERELRQPAFLDLCAAISDPASLMMFWTRDAWQASARLPIDELHIGPTPIGVAKLTPEIWRQILTEAYGCLDASRGHRGRALQEVTLKSGPAKKYVSPHIQIQRVLWRGSGPTLDEAVAIMRRAMEQLRPLHQAIGRY